jgi:hypothetical protein
MLVEPIKLFSIHSPESVKHIKCLVRVRRAMHDEYAQRIDRKPIQLTLQRNLPCDGEGDGTLSNGISRNISMDSGNHCVQMNG